MTTQRGLLQPTVGGDSGVWGGYLNTNATTINKMFGNILEVAVASGATLTLANMEYGIIRFTGTLTGNVDVTFQHVEGSWLIDNQTTGNFYVRLKTTAASTATIGIPQGATSQVYIDATSAVRQGFKFVDVDKPGTIWQTMYDTAPVWLNGCTSDGSTLLLPWISCDGEEYAQATYPYLYSILGITWVNTGGRPNPAAGNFRVPDFRNEVLVSVMPTSPRLTSGVSGLAGQNTGSQVYAESVALTQAQLPQVTPAGTVALVSSTITTSVQGGIGGGGSNSLAAAGGTGSSTTTSSAITAASLSFTGTPFGGNQALTSVQPTTVHGLTFVKT